MNVIIGYVVVIGMIFGAFLIHGGAIGVILSAMPTEMMAILGGAMGAFIVANQTKNLKAVARALPAAGWKRSVTPRHTLSRAACSDGMAAARDRPDCGSSRACSPPVSRVSAEHMAK